MNAAFSDPSIVRTFPREFLREHLDRDTFGMDDREALTLFRVADHKRRCASTAKSSKAEEVYNFRGMGFPLDHNLQNRLHHQN
jgi:hypothetical protein